MRKLNPEVAKNGQNYFKDLFKHEIHLNRGFWGQGFKKSSQNFCTLVQCPCTRKKIAKMCAKYMLYIDLYVFWAKDFKNATKIFVNLPTARARAKKLQKCMQNTCCISIYMFLGPRISKMQQKNMQINQCATVHFLRIYFFFASNDYQSLAKNKLS